MSERCDTVCGRAKPCLIHDEHLDETPLILTDAEAGDCYGVAVQLRSLAIFILDGKGIPAKDRASFLNDAATLLERVYVAHVPPKHACKGEQCESWSIMRDRTRGYAPPEESAFVAGWHIAHE